MKQLLEVSALVLSVVNGLMLLREYLRDRPVLKVHAIHPQVYQWWCRWPEGNWEGQPTRRYGFWLYIAIDNHGLRRVAVNSWRLFIKTYRHRWRGFELMAINTPEPTLEIEGIGTKILPVLGQKGLYYEGGQVVDSGCGIIGTALFVAEFYGHESWNPIIKDGKIRGTLVVRDVLGGKAKKTMTFSEHSWEEFEKIMPGTESVTRNHKSRDEAQN